MKFIKRLFGKKMLLVTHDGGFHADDVMAYAILQEVLSKRGQRWKLFRTRRGQTIIDHGDIVFDTGNEYDPGRNRYDHHQVGRAGARENGVMYASSGLIWKHFGRELCSNDGVWQYIDRGIIQEMDAVDSGQNYINGILFPDAGYTSLGIHIANFETATSKEKTPEMIRRSFEEAATFARGILVRAINSCESFEQAFREATEVYNNSADKQILIFEKNYERPTWRRLAEFPEPIYAVYPNNRTGGWKVEAITATPITLNSRKLFPESWWGLRDEELCKACGVSDARFCHASGFLLETQTKENAITLAKKALENL